MNLNDIEPCHTGLKSTSLYSTQHVDLIQLFAFLGGYMKSSARVIADSIINLSKKSLIELQSSPGKN